MFPQNTEIPNECGDAEYEDDLDKLQSILLATFLSTGFITVTVACVYYYNRPQGIPPSLRPASKRSRNTDDVVNNPMNSRSSLRESSVDKSITLSSGRITRASEQIFGTSEVSAKAKAKL